MRQRINATALFMLQTVISYLTLGFGVRTAQTDILFGSLIVITSFIALGYAARNFLTKFDQGG